MLKHGRMYSVLLLLLLLASGCGKSAPGAAVATPPPVSGVTAGKLTLTPVNDYCETTGTVKAANVAILSAKTTGAVTAVRVRQGERVQAGQTLLTIEANDVSQRAAAAVQSAAAAESQLHLAEATYDRYRQLWIGSAISRQQLDEMEARKQVAEAEYARARASVAEASAAVSYTVITAPTAGLVTDKKIDVGSMVSPGLPLLTVEDTASFAVEAQADERWAGRITPGMPAEIVLDALGRSVSGQVTEVSPWIDPVSRTFYIKTAAADPALRTGMYARIRFPVGQHDALVVPETALVKKGQLTGVYAVSPQGQLTYRLIKTGPVANGQTEILSGLTPGETIILSGTERAVDGGRLEGVKLP